MEIPLTAEVTAALQNAARLQGTTPELLASECLHARYGNGSLRISPAGSLADFLGDSLGALASGTTGNAGAHLSKDPHGQFVQGLKKKREQGRL